MFLSSLRTRGGGEEGDRWSCAMGSAARRGLLSALALALAARAAGLDGGPATTRLRELKTVPLGVVAGGSASQKIAERKTFWEQYREGVRLEAFAGLDSVDDDAIEENEMGTQGGDDIERCSTAAEMLEKKGADYTCAFVTERCSGRGLGPLNYLQLPYHPASDFPQARGIFPVSKRWESFLSHVPRNLPRSDLAPARPHTAAVTLPPSASPGRAR